MVGACARRWKSRNRCEIAFALGLGIFSLFAALSAGALVAAPMPGQADTEAARQFTAWVSAGSEALARGEDAKAEDFFRKALALDPGSVELLNNLAISVARQGRYEAAIDLYRSALSLRKDDPITGTPCPFCADLPTTPPPFRLSTSPVSICSRSTAMAKRLLILSARASCSRRTSRPSTSSEEPIGAPRTTPD
jgi:tetratricopeptide (TPR) repeat protein